MPKYSNPTGTVYSDQTVERLAAMTTAAPDFRLFWDNAYAVHHLTAERIEIANIVDACARHGHANRPFVFGSTSKITLAGAGVALFGSSPQNVAWYLKRMGRRTIGGDKINQLRHVRFLRRSRRPAGPDGPASRRHRAEVRDRHRDVFTRTWPAAGSRRGPSPRAATSSASTCSTAARREVVTLAKQAGVELTPAGSTFPLLTDPRDRNIRIAPTYPDQASVGARGRRRGAERAGRHDRRAARPLNAPC